MGSERFIESLLIEIDSMDCVNALDRMTNIKNRTEMTFDIKTDLVVHANETGIFMMFVL
jgi:hypothetical protein